MNFENNQDYSLRLLLHQDMEPIRRWRNSQIDILRQSSHLSHQEQEAYWKEVVAPSYQMNHPDQLLVAFLEGSQLIGYGGITHIDWERKEGEVSFLLNPEEIESSKNYRKKFGIFLELIKTAAFDKLNLIRLFTETYDIRPDHISELEARGFQLKKRLTDAIEVRGRKVDALIHEYIADER
ncbi:putative uncharacterized protein [Waddlia chondrophila 2032/99]|uniref:N-acetyltransferase domain-containing protein n=1 Tax=Waddlia chondrophila 2032/99 TaxID=765953 RepID=F8LDE5_9BACT|nr:GNAT family N-acetyltransferase [Waddlia chondrophila]CCB91421.1 putative uncharacterized protein [Waddlia chondrophila 2032/99]